MERSTILVALSLGTVAGIALFASNANAATTDDGASLAGVSLVTPPAGYSPPAVRPQSRPIPASSAFTGTDRLDILSIAQEQLNQLGYGPMPVTGVDDARTGAVAAYFNRDQPRAVRAYQNAGMDLAHATLSAIDDKYRQSVGADVAMDFVAPSGSLSLARNRGRV